MVEAYSRLKFLLEERSLTPVELQRRIAAEERAFNLKTFYRLADPERPLERLDMRVVGAVCRALSVSLSDLIIFAEPAATLRTLPEAEQRRLDELMDRHSQEQLPNEELAELRALVAKAEEIALANARRLAEHRRRLRGRARTNRPVAAG